MKIQNRRRCFMREAIVSALVVIAATWEECTCFTTNTIPFQRRGTKNTLLNLIPISRFKADMTYFSLPDTYRGSIDESGKFIAGNNDHSKDGKGEEEDFELCIVEQEDLSDLATFVVDVFGEDAIALSSDLNDFETAILTPATSFLNGYSNIIAYIEVISGLKSRTKDRVSKGHINDISPPPVLNDSDSREDKLSKAASTALILCVARRKRTEFDGSNTSKNLEIIGSVELRLQPCDAKIPFTLPWLDKVERSIASKIGFSNTDKNARDLQPYLSNLCVDERYRRNKLGVALCRVIEDITRSTWNYKQLFLHVDPVNKAAYNLYKKEGYIDVGKRWNPFWAGSAANIAYLVKTLE